MDTGSLHHVVVLKNDRIVGFATQSGIAQALFDHLDSLNMELSSKILEKSDSNIYTVSVRQEAIEAFQLITNMCIRCVGVVDDDGKLVGNVSSRDVRVCRKLSPIDSPAAHLN